jgi:NAD+ synthase (glutamine-hydrolysing)
MNTAWRLALGQMRVYPGEPERNGDTAFELLAKACDSSGEIKADLLVLPEMAVPGYLLGDLWERDAYLRACEDVAVKLIAATRGKSCALLFGTVGIDWKAKGEDGRPRKFNAFVFAQDGQAFIHPATGYGFGIKTLQPNYREFDDHRHFYDTRRLCLEAEKPLRDYLVPIPLKVGAEAEGTQIRLGVHLCEDGWQDDYAQKPMDMLAQAGAEVFVNLSASPFTRGKNGKRNRVFGALAARLKRPMAYVNAVSLQNNAKTIYTFDGSSTVYADDGKLALELPGFATGLGWVDLAPASELLNEPAKVFASESGDKPQRHMQVTSAAMAVDGEATSAVSLRHVDSAKLDSMKLNPTTTTKTATTAWPQIVGKEQVAHLPDMPLLHQALRFGVQAFLKQTGLGKVVIGVSGGIDSAVSAALFRECLAPENLLLVNMPSRFNSATTRDLAEDLAARLGCPYLVLPIENGVALTEKQIDKVSVDVPGGDRKVVLSLAGLGLENVQARDRGARLLAAVAAAFGGVFVCNTNKTEMTVGYGTLYGDIAGFMAPLADLWKREVYALGHYLNDVVYKRIVIPQGIFTVMPSAELSPAQAVDEGKGDPLIYPYHDRLFFAFVQRWRRASPEDVLGWYLDARINQELGMPDGVDVYQLFPKAADFITDLERWWGLYNGLGVVKRLQAPPILAVSSRAFGFDHRESLLPVLYSAKYREMKTKAIQD